MEHCFLFGSQVYEADPVKNFHRIRWISMVTMATIENNSCSKPNRSLAPLKSEPFPLCFKRLFIPRHHNIYPMHTMRVCVCVCGTRKVTGKVTNKKKKSLHNCFVFFFPPSLIAKWIPFNVRFFLVGKNLFLYCTISTGLTVSVSVWEQAAQTTVWHGASNYCELRA